MRASAVAVVIAVVAAVASCGPSSQPPGSTGGYDQFGCKTSCDRCPMETLCVGAPNVPACLVQCRVTADCDPGLRCAIITVDFAPSVCVGPSSLTLCDPPTACTAAAECRDGMTQLKPLPTSFGACGWEVIHCDMGCDSATGSCK
ncbi:MAG: hypothetical protein JWM53_6356 [bacterium]|nr:hypothetical protein [bacterium]